MAMAQSAPVPIGLGFPNAKLSIQPAVSSLCSVNLTHRSSRKPAIVCSAEKPQRRISRSTSTSTSGTSSINGSDDDDERGNIILRAAWYGAEALGNIVSVFSPKNPTLTVSDTSDAFQGPLARDFVVQAIKDDYEKGYFVTGNVSSGVYEEDCEFADPAGSFKSLKRFKNNCSNFGALLEKSDVKLVKWEELNDKFIAYWRFSCVLKFPWRPILSSTGFTEYYFDQDSGRICRHAENWDVPKMVLLGQVFKPNPTFKLM